MQKSSFNGENKYKLYRTVYDIIHPSISKKNISNYKIILDNNITPIRVFYPKKITTNTSIIIFIPSSISLVDENTDYSNVCKNLSTHTNSIVLGIDYNSSNENSFTNAVEECYKVIKYIFDELDKNNISKDNILLMGDSLGSNIITKIITNCKKDNIYIKKTILSSLIVDKTDDIEKNKVNVIQLNKFKDFFSNYNKEGFIYPIENNDYEKYPEILLFVGAADPLFEKTNNYYNKLKDNNVKVNLVKITFADHNVIGNNDPDIKDELYKNILEFLNS